jgi:hypothetical protein
MARITYKKSISGLNALMRSAEVRDVLRQAAERGAELAREISPVHTGEYRDSFTVTTQDVAGVHQDRAGARIVNSSPHAARVEWEDGYHVLARVADALGAS